MIINKLVIFMPSIEGGGVEKNFFIISNFLAKNLKKVYVVTADKVPKKKLNNIEIIKPKLKFWSNAGRFRKYFICIILLSITLIKNRKITILSFQANIYAIIICKIFNTKIIIRSNSDPCGWSKNSLKKLIFKLIFNLADKIIVNSQDLKKNFFNQYKVNSKCIYNPLDYKRIYNLAQKKINFPFYKKNSLNIVSLGRLVDQKQQLVLIQALNELKKKINFKAVIIGQGKLKNILNNKIIEFNLSKKVKIINFQKNPYNILKKSDLLIHTAKYEGLPNVLLEALVLKKFIISSNCPTGPREILDNGKGGLLFKVGNFKELSKKIIYYKNNMQKLKKKIFHARSLLHRFDIKKNLNKYLSTVQKI